MMAKPRSIKDCERDQKGIHEWELVAEVTSPRYSSDYFYWCYKCGAVGESGYDNPKRFGMRTVTVLKRVQE